MPEKILASLASYHPTIMVSETHRTIEAIWRIESAKVIAGLSRLIRDVGLAEELAQDALVAALEQWSGRGSRISLAHGS